MKLSHLRLALILSDRVYQGLVCLFPSAFRRMYGPQMTRMFRQCCREAIQHHGLKGLTRLWLHILADFTVNLVLEWSATLHKQARDYWPSLLSPLVGLLAGYAYLHTENGQGLTLFLLLCVMCAGLLGYLQPKGAWERALLIVAGVPFVRFIDIIMNYPLPCHTYLFAMFLAGVSALVGASSGVGLGTIIRRFFMWPCCEVAWLNVGANRYMT